ncbi:MAG: Na+/H+ antiporter NhaC family protein [Pleurocapsa sp.]
MYKLKKILVFSFLLFGTIALSCSWAIAKQEHLTTAMVQQDYPGWLALLPPLLVVVLAFIWRQVIVALFLGIWLGAWINYNLSFSGFFYALLDTIPVYIRGELVNEEHMSIVIFSLAIGGMVGIITKNGGTIALVNCMIPWASSPRRGQFATSLLGILIFFDDYANTLIVGHAMRPITDYLRISREKLAYLIDSTAAPVASLGLVTTWIGYEVGLIGDAVAKIDNFTADAYVIFLNSLPYSFYPLLAIFFVFAVVLTQKDFGAMYTAEYLARQTVSRNKTDPELRLNNEEQGVLQPKTDKLRLINAILPVLVLLVATAVGLYVTGTTTAGTEATFPEIISKGDSIASLLWASLFSAIAAGVLSLAQGILTLSETVDAWLAGMKSMLPTIVILALAWGFSAVLDEIGTSEFLTSLLTQRLAPELLPTFIFLLSGTIAFATGSSWGTMAILMPLALPLSWTFISPEDTASLIIFYSSVSTVLAGAVWGDHCSPLSDTTILSAMVSQCDPVAHVKTQLPYAFVVGAIAVVLGTLPTGFGMPWWMGLFLGAGMLLLILHIFGQKTN